MSSRRRARESVLKALYAYEQSEPSDPETGREVLASSRLSDRDRNFARTLYETVVDNIEEIDRFISGLATNWKLERLALLDKNILRMAICEVKNMPDIPLKVAINEAIELAKKYSTQDSAAFVNGILDRVMHIEGTGP
jgi:N utilization substance protein B